MNDARQSITPRGPADDPAVSFGELSRFAIRALKARFRDHAAEMSVIRRHIKAGDTVCDIGANKGSFVYWLSRWVGKGGRVVAFEAQDDLARRLDRICRSAALHNVTVEAKAVHATSGSHELHIPVRHQPGASLNRPDLPGDEIITTSVATVALDDYFADAAEPVSVLKVDVEGAEPGVFAGARRILANRRPLLFFECENRHLNGGSVRDVFTHLKSIGYDGHFVASGRLLPVSLFDEAIHQRRDGEWFWKRKDYCNNFIFSASKTG
jgi:FkbM family methyltransferase